MSEMRSYWKRMLIGCGLLILAAPLVPARAEARSALMEAALTFETVEPAAPATPWVDPWLDLAPAPKLLDPPTPENPLDAASRSVLEWLSRHRYTPTPTLTIDTRMDAILLGLTWYR